MENENWKTIPNYAGYEISSVGRVRSFWRRTGVGGQKFNKWEWKISTIPKTLKYSVNCDGYHMVNLREKMGKHRLLSIHTLLLKAFVGPRPDGLHGCHIDDDKNRNELDNLEWNTK